MLDYRQVLTKYLAKLRSSEGYLTSGYPLDIRNPISGFQMLNIWISGFVSSTFPPMPTTEKVQEREREREREREIEIEREIRTGKTGITFLTSEVKCQ